MNYYLFIPFVIIVVCFIPIKLEGRVSFNFLDLSGAFGIFFYKIKVTHQQVWIKHKKIMLKKDNHVESKEISFDSDEIVFVNMLISQVKDKTRLRVLSVFYNLGLDDAFLTSMAAGYINVLMLIFFTNIKNTKPTASLGVYDSISYNRQVCQFAVKCVLSISLFDVAYSLIRSVILTKRELTRRARNSKKEAKWNIIRQTVKE